MKYIKLLLIIFIATSAIAQESQIPVESKVVKVTVFPEGAQVTRKGHSAIPAGKSELVFSGLSPYADASSVKVEGSGTFTILSVSPQPNKLKEQKKIKEIEEIEKARDAFKKEQTREQAYLDVYKQEERMLDATKKIGGENTGVKAADLSAVLDLHRTRLLELKSLQIDYKEKVKKLDDTLSRLNAQIRLIKHTENQSTTDIVVTISAATATAGDFSVSYVVKNAGWYPSYDLRVDDVSKPLTLDYKANVYQSTGEEWKDIKITFSNGNPNESGIAPILKPLLLSDNNVSFGKPKYPINPNIKEVSGKVTDPHGEALIGATIQVVGTTIGTTSDYEGNYRLQVPQGSSQIRVNYIGMRSQTLSIYSSKLDIRLQDQTVMLDEVVVSEAPIEEQLSRAPGVTMNEKKARRKSYIDEDKNSNVTYSENKPNATSVTFELATPYTVINDGKNRSVDMKQEEIPAGFEYFCVPKLDKSVYLVGHIPNWLDYNLLEGEVNLYYEGTYTGKTLFSLSNAEDTLHLSLGHDKALSVSRNKVKEFSRNQVLSDKKSASSTFEIAVRNNKKFPINLVIEDQIPLSAEKEITIDNTSYDGAQLEESTGKLTWKLNLAPAKEKKLKLSYTVKYPKSYRVQID